MVGKVAQLEFRLVDDDPSRLKSAIEGNVPQGFILKYVKEKEREPVLLEDQAALSGERVSDAKVDFDTQGFGQPYISLTLDNEGAAEFANVTRTHVGRRLAILLDGEVLSAPNIKGSDLRRKRPDLRVNSLWMKRLCWRWRYARARFRPRCTLKKNGPSGLCWEKDSIEAGINATRIGASLVFFSWSFITSRRDLSRTSPC